MEKVLKITGWDVYYENNESRKVKYLSWIKIPNTHDGEGYCIMVEGDSGAAILGAWVACLQIASRCNPRGYLIRKSGVPHTAASLAIRARLPIPPFQEMINRALLPAVGWMEEVDISKVMESGIISRHAGMKPGCTGELSQKKTQRREEKRREREDPPPPSSVQESRESRGGGIFEGGISETAAVELETAMLKWKVYPPNASKFSEILAKAGWTVVQLTACWNGVVNRTPKTQDRPRILIAELKNALKVEE